MPTLDTAGSVKHRRDMKEYQQNGQQTFSNLLKHVQGSKG